MMADERAKSPDAGRGVGVNAKLQGAFGAVAILTVIAAAVAIFSFSSTERGFERVSGHEVPVMTDALRLSAVSGEISAAAARFVSTPTRLAPRRCLRRCGATCRSTAIRPSSFSARRTVPA